MYNVYRKFKLNRFLGLGAVASRVSNDLAMKMWMGLMMRTRMIFLIRIWKKDKNENEDKDENCDWYQCCHWGQYFVRDRRIKTRRRVKLLQSERAAEENSLWLHF